MAQYDKIYFYDYRNKPAVTSGQGDFFFKGKGILLYDVIREYLTTSAYGLNVDLTTPPVNGNVLKYNGTAWVAGTDTHIGNTDLTVTSDRIINGNSKQLEFNNLAAFYVQNAAEFYVETDLLDIQVAGVGLSGTNAHLSLGNSNTQYLHFDLFANTTELSSPALIKLLTANVEIGDLQGESNCDQVKTGAISLYSCNQRGFELTTFDLRDGTGYSELRNKFKLGRASDNMSGNRNLGTGKLELIINNNSGKSNGDVLTLINNTTGEANWSTPATAQNLGNSNLTLNNNRTLTGAAFNLTFTGITDYITTNITNYTLSTTNAFIKINANSGRNVGDVLTLSNVSTGACSWAAPGGGGGGIDANASLTANRTLTTGAFEYTISAATTTKNFLTFNNTNNAGNVVNTLLWKMLENTTHTPISDYISQTDTGMIMLAQSRTNSISSATIQSGTKASVVALTYANETSALISNNVTNSDTSTSSITLNSASTKPNSYITIDAYPNTRNETGTAINNILYTDINGRLYSGDINRVVLDYSTSEQLTPSKWTNNAPIYQRTITVAGNSVTNIAAWGIIKVIKFEGTITSGTSTAPIQGLNNVGYTLRYDSSNTSLYSDYAADITIFYTKS